jgi:hypothetical protein
VLHTLERFQLASRDLPIPPGHRVQVPDDDCQQHRVKRTGLDRKKSADPCEKVNGSVVARDGVEPSTFRFSGGRSYQLSYLAGATGQVGRTRLATQTGLEPATFAVTGRRANQLRHWALLRSVLPTGFEPALPP